MIRRTHLACGLVMLTYVTAHLLNHAFGVISLQAMEAARPWFVGPWATAPGIAVLALAALTHISLALLTTFRRCSLRMPVWQWTQLALGLTIPFLIVEHALATGGSRLAFGVEPSYAFVLATLWKFAPEKGWLQALVLVVAWTHASFGIHHWLKVKAWYPAWRPILYAAALVVPTAALLGFVGAGVEARGLAGDPAWVARMAADIRYPGPAMNAFVERGASGWQAALAGLIAAVFVARGARALAGRFRPRARVVYPGGRRVASPEGATILETSRFFRIPHASVCGGRGRCSTCRVRVVRGIETLDDPAPEECKVLRRLGLPPNVRLACQTRPKPGAEIEIEPLLPPTASMRDVHRRERYLQGEERDIAIMFCDMRGFTKLAEKRLPYDVVFLLNRYFAAMGGAIEEAGGRIDKFIGDGIMALFGIDSGSAAGCREALAAARRMAVELDALNKALAHDLPEPLRIGIGIHAGPVIVGEMGYGKAVTVTAIGDAVNTASRLESMTKEAGVQLMVSEVVAERAGLSVDDFERMPVMVRGRQEALSVLKVPSAAGLPEA